MMTILHWTLISDLPVIGIVNWCREFKSVILLDIDPFVNKLKCAYFCRKKTWVMSMAGSKFTETYSARPPTLCCSLHWLAQDITLLSSPCVSSSSPYWETCTQSKSVTLSQSTILYSLGLMITKFMQ